MSNNQDAAAADAVDFKVSRLPLSHDVMTSFEELVRLPSQEPIQHPLSSVFAVARMPDGRYVLTENCGETGSVVGAPVATLESVELAKTLLAADLPASASNVILRKLAVTLLGVLHDKAYGNVIRFPSARGAA